MNAKSIFRNIAVVAALLSGGTAAYAQNSDTSKVCTGQNTLPKGPTPPVGVTYTYAWFDGQNNSAGGTQEISIPGATLTNTTGAPVQFVYKLVVSQSGAGISACPSDTFYKVIIVYPALNNTLTPNFAVICPSGGVNLVLTSPTTAGATLTPALFGNYGTLQYAWSGSGIPANTTTTGLANNSYTLLSASLPAPSAIPYTYTAVASYADALVGTAPVLAACAHSANTQVTISAAPSINSTNVTTTFQ